MKKKIWLINPYCSPPEKETRLRGIKFARYLQEDGYEVKIFAGSALHNSSLNYINTDEKYIEKKYDELDFVQIKNVNYKGNGIKRLLSLQQFYSGFEKIYQDFEKPDVILHTLTVPFGKKISSIARKMEALYFGEVLDLWPESFLEYGLIKQSNPMFPYLRKKEKDIYYSVDELFFSMEGGKDYIIERGWDKRDYHPIDLDKVHYINNGVDLKDFYFNVEHYRLSDKDLEDDSYFKIIYLGSIRLANDVQQIIDAARILQPYKKIKFLIYGDGGDREYLEHYIEENNINNVFFKEKWIDIKYVPYVLSRSNLNLLNYKHSHIARFGGSQSKLFQYMASGKPICSNIEMGYCLINKYNLGIAKEFGSSEEYANAMLKIANYSEEKVQRIKEKSQKVVKEFDYKYLTHLLENIIEMDSNNE